MGDTFQVAYQLQDVGAAAIVMRSLFHEQMPSSAESEQRSAHRAAASGEFPDYADYQLSPEHYLRQVECLKKMLTIPVIASLNGHRPAEWIEYARRLQGAGADAIELNFYQVITDPSISADRVETEILKTVGDIAGAVSIPVAVKLSPFHASVAQLAVALELAGAAGVVVFNRFYQPDVNTTEISVQPRLELSDSSELRLRLRWLAILSPLLRGTLVAGGGIHTADDVVKALLTGAHAVMPGSLYSSAPLIRKSRPKRVFPEPALPQTKVVLLVGSPPSVIWSKPLMPVGLLWSGSQSEILFLPGVVVIKVILCAWYTAPCRLLAERLDAGKYNGW